MTSSDLHQRHVLKVSRFQPFESRIGTDTVIRLKFPWDRNLVDELKRLLSLYRREALNPDRNQHAPGGWLPEHRCWFIEPIIWPVVKMELVWLGYAIVEDQDA